MQDVDNIQDVYSWLEQVVATNLNLYCSSTLPSVC